MNLNVRPNICKQYCKIINGNKLLIFNICPIHKLLKSTHPYTIANQLSILSGELQ